MTASVEETQAYGRVAGEKAQPGDLWCITGPLGAGKTAFVQGLADGLGFKGPVTSPTFGLHHIYMEGRLPLHHFDWYRLKDAGEVLDLGFLEWVEKAGICIVEWGDRFPKLMPPHCIKLTLELIDQQERRLLLEASDARSIPRAEELILCWPP